MCKEYVSFDRLMGMCLCKTDDLEELCNLECRIAQRYRVSFKCSEPPLEPHLVLRDANNTIVVRTSVMSANNTHILKYIKYISILCLFV